MTALLAYTYDPAQTLPALKKELDIVQAALTHRDCNPHPIWNPESSDIRDIFDTYATKVGIFHFSGHAFGDYIQLSDALDVKRFSFVESLADSVCQYKGLRLVFLNGCSTADQAAAFLKNGVPLVISTRQPLKDRYGLAFARLFYQEFCTKNKPVKNAFADATKGFLTDYKHELKDWRDTELDQSLRGGGFDVDETEELYLLDIHPAYPQAGAERFTDWLSAALPQPVVEIKEPQHLQSLGIHPDAYLLCNRRTEARNFDKKAKEKLEGAIHEPIFIFIHDEEPDCPTELSKRLMSLSARKLCPALPTPVTIDLEPLQDEFVDDEKYRLALTELFAESFPERKRFDDAQNRWVLQKISPDENLLLIHHDLTALSWEPAWEQLFRYYIEEYSKALRVELSARLMVVCTLEYFQANDPFKALLQQLATDFPDRVLNFTSLENINPKHVGIWQTEVFNEKFFSSETLFLENGNQINELPFLSVKEKLKEKIRSYNQSHRQ
jgi:hypothetical protein